MSPRYLLDTNIVSAPSWKRPPPGLAEKLDACALESAIPSPVWHELRYGCARLSESRRRTMLQRYLDLVIESGVVVLEYDRAAAEWHAAERARLDRAGETAPFVDGQIAAIARVRGLVLVTDNTSDFRRFEGLEMESWIDR